MNCIHCGKEVAWDYRRDGEGNYFCHDQCYDQFDHEGSDVYPYIDTYEGIRRDYLKWSEEWEDVLEASEDYLKEIKRLTESYRAYLWDFFSFTGEGDGVYAEEIHLYMGRIEELIEKIQDWRPRRKKFISVFLYFNRDFLTVGENYEKAYDAVLDQVFLRLDQKGYLDVEEIVDQGFITNQGDEPFDNELFLVYETEMEARKVKEAFQRIFSEAELEIDLHPAVLCDCQQCGSYVSDFDECDVAGWKFYPFCRYRRSYIYYYK